MSGLQRSVPCWAYTNLDCNMWCTCNAGQWLRPAVDVVVDAELLMNLIILCLGCFLPGSLFSFRLNTRHSTILTPSIIPESWTFHGLLVNSYRPQPTSEST